MADPDLSGVLQSVTAAYPQLAPHVANMAVQWAPDPKDGRQLEFYMPQQPDNPNPGKITSELYNRGLSGQSLTDAIAGDVLHYVGSMHPQTGQPVDQTYRALKDQMIQSFTPGQQAANKAAYQQEVSQYGPLMTDYRTGKTVDYPTFMDENRADAYMRAGVFPSNNPEWKDFLTPQQQAIGAQAQQYLQSPQPQTAAQPNAAAWLP